MNITTLIIIATGIITYMGFENRSLFEKYKFSVSGIQAGEYYRLISSAFLHADWTHFFVNMLTLYFFGDYVNTVFGTPQYLSIYFGGVVVGNYLSYYFHKNDLWYAAIGASGGVNAIIFAAIALDPFQKLYLYFFIPIPGIIFALGYLWYTTKSTQNAMSRIGHEAHFGGALTGVALAIIFDYKAAFLAHPLISLVLIGALAGGYYYMEKKL